MSDGPAADLAAGRAPAGLLSRCRAAEEGAWEELVSAYARLVYSIPRSYGFGADDAADVAQATFLSLYQGLDSLREDDAVAGWLGTVARRHTWRLIDRARRERDEQERQTHAMADVDESGPGRDVYDDWVDRAWLAQGMAALDARCRALLTVLFLDDVPYQAAAARLGIAVGTIGPARARCLSRLRLLLGD